MHPRSWQLGQNIRNATHAETGIGSLFRHFQVLPMDKAVRAKTIMLQASDHQIHGIHCAERISRNGGKFGGRDAPSA
jgi:hypothetical protein